MAVDPKEYEEMVVPNYPQLVKMLDKGVVKKLSRNSKVKKFKFGFRKGAYLGAPGKDVYFVMPSLTDEQFSDVAVRFANMYPNKAPDNHLHWAACIRYVYGCFEKQGCLRSNADKKRIIKEDPDWDMPIRFMSLALEQFKKNKNHYGRVLHYEMLAHRFGDRAIIDKNPELLNEMISHYENSQRLAMKCKSYKHMFTPFYWAGHYYYEMDFKKECIKYHTLSLQHMEKYCPDARDGYRDKAMTSFKHLKESMEPRDWKKMRSWIHKCNNKCLAKVKNKA